MDANIPMMGFIGRLDYQKGVDLIRDNYDWLMSGEGDGWLCIEGMASANLLAGCLGRAGTEIDLVAGSDCACLDHSPARKKVVGTKVLARTAF